MNYFKKFNLLDIENNSYKKIFGGQQQKFKFLISLLNEPNLLVLDEITTSLICQEQFQKKKHKKLGETY